MANLQRFYCMDFRWWTEVPPSYPHQTHPTFLRPLKLRCYRSLLVQLCFVLRRKVTGRVSWES